MSKQQRAIYDFGFEPEQSPHHFALVRGSTGDVRVEERFQWGEPEESDRAPELKARLDAYRWERVAGQAQTTFNQRLRRDNLRSARWKARETLLAPDYGRELTLLAWAVEDADPTLLPNMLSNWAGLAPEERWWLYTTINATSGHPEHGKERGWRKAIKIAFADNPTFEVSPGAFLSDRLPREEEPPSKRGRKRGPAPGQLSLIAADEEQP